MTNNGNMMPEGGRSIIGWVMIVAIIALILLIMLIIFGNLDGNVGFGQTSTAFSNETITLSPTGDTPLTAEGRVNGNLSGLVITNVTSGLILLVGNYSVDGVLITNASLDYPGNEVNVSGTVTYDEDGKVASDGLIGNYSKSATNVGEQFPVTGTIVGIALLLLVLLFILGFAISRLMKMSNGGGSSGGGGSSSFSGSSSSNLN